MPSVLTDAALSRAATAAASAAAQHLPAAPVAQQVDDSAAPVLPGADAVAIAVRLGGAVTGSLLLLVSAAEAAPLLEGPLAAADVETALEPALLAAVEALRASAGGPLQAEACRSVDATVALDLAQQADASAVVPLAAGEVHVATLVLCVEAAAIPAPRRPARSEAPDPHRLQLLHDVPMGVTVQLGSTRMTVRELLALAPGALVELDRAAGSPVDVLVNGTLLARGEVVVVDEEYAVRISEIVSTPVERSGRP